MKKSLIVLVAMAFVLALSLPALADVGVTGTVTVEKEKNSKEEVCITKVHYIEAVQISKPTNSAQAQAVKNDVNEGNVISEAPSPFVPPTREQLGTQGAQGEVIDPGHPEVLVNKKAIIGTASGDNSSGVIGINQSPGSLNNQGNAVSVSMTEDAGSAILHAESAAEKINQNNRVMGMPTSDAVATVESTNTLLCPIDRSQRANTIDAALMTVHGILGVNQSAGSMNNQDNAASLAVGANAIACLSESDLGMVNSGNLSCEMGVNLTDTISNGALGGAQGIVAVNQSSGCMNNQANVVAVCAVLSPF